jgi:hypothetical protein
VSRERIELDESITVYNFTVEGNHDYFVIAQTDEFGQICVLVHNAEGYDSRYKPQSCIMGCHESGDDFFLPYHGQAVRNPARNDFLRLADAFMGSPFVAIDIARDAHSNLPPEVQSGIISTGRDISLYFGDKAGYVVPKILNKLGPVWPLLDFAPIVHAPGPNDSSPPPSPPVPPPNPPTSPLQ